MCKCTDQLFLGKTCVFKWGGRISVGLELTWDQNQQSSVCLLPSAGWRKRSNPSLFWFQLLRNICLLPPVVQLEVASRAVGSRTSSRFWTERLSCWVWARWTSHSASHVLELLTLKQTVLLMSDEILQTSSNFVLWPVLVHESLFSSRRFIINDGTCEFRTCRRTEPADPFELWGHIWCFLLVLNFTETRKDPVCSVGRGGGVHDGVNFQMDSVHRPGVCPSQAPPLDPMAMKRSQLYGMSSSPYPQQQGAPYPGQPYGSTFPHRYQMGMSGRGPTGMGGRQFPQQQVGNASPTCKLKEILPVVLGSFTRFIMRLRSFCILKSLNSVYFKKTNLKNCFQFAATVKPKY